MIFFGFWSRRTLVLSQFTISIVLLVVGKQEARLQRLLSFYLRLADGFRHLEPGTELHHLHLALMHRSAVEDVRATYARGPLLISSTWKTRHACSPPKCKMGVGNSRNELEYASHHNNLKSVRLPGAFHHPF